MCVLSKVRPCSGCMETLYEATTSDDQQYMIVRTAAAFSILTEPDKNTARAQIETSIFYYETRCK